jgi:DNA invertase Pin-like site-specific DNA recombinase
MIAVIYARRSTDEHQADSLDVQQGEATRFIRAKGWTLATERPTYIDDAVSRAEFKKRPGLLSLLTDAEKQPRPFDVVVMRDESRLGGDTFRAGLAIQDLIESGVKLFYYYTGEEVRVDGAIEKFLVAARSFAAELEREKIAQRTHEHLLTKARRGLNVGGRVFGYDNHEVREGDRRIRVEYRINEEQAAVIRDIFRRYARGEGLRAIVKSLNARRVPPPRAGKRGTGSWSTSAVWAMLRRDRYRGVLVWGKNEKTYKRGTKVRVPREQCDWITVKAPHLRIVSDELWCAAHAQMRKVAPRGRKKGGRPHRYLLSGIARCGACGGPLTVINGKASYEPIKVYACAWHRERGPSVCPNKLRRPVDAVNRMVVDWINGNVLSEHLVLETLTEVRRRLVERAKTANDDLPRLEKEASTLRAALDRLVDALARSTDKPDAIVRGITERQERLSALDAQIRAARAAPGALDLEVRRLEVEAKKRIHDLRGLLERSGEEGRKVIAALFDGPLTATPIETPEGPRYRVKGKAVIGRMLTAEVSNVASPAGSCTSGFPRMPEDLLAGEPLPHLVT